MKVGFATVVFPQKEEYTQEYIDSINGQDYKDFELIVVNDGLPPEEVLRIKSELRCHSIWENASTGSSISDNRINILKSAKEMAYDVIIFGDFDDTFRKDRISSVVKAYDEKYTFYYHNVCDVKSGKSVFKGLPDAVSDVSSILESNFLGLSNTAIKISDLSSEYINSFENVETNVFDWYLFSRLLCDGFAGKRIDGAYTYYRQHDNNIVGINKTSRDMIKKEISVKKCHYALMKKYNNIYDDLEKKYSIVSPDDACGDPDSGYWWSNINLYSIK